ncbi:MAG: hypothetical protein LBJ08_04910 [Bifidobacteriaceae bacterium]|nr:hypothetical protein [Bifidobacteriaceae bacterium]
MTDALWGNLGSQLLGGNAPTAPLVDTSGIAQSVQALDQASATLAGAVPAKWTSPAVAAYLSRLNHLRSMTLTGRSLCEHAHQRAVAYNNAVQADAAGGGVR